MDTNEILEKLASIVGGDHVSNRKEELFSYSRDPGASLPRDVDIVVLPYNTEEIQDILKLANQEKIPVIPMGAGLTLSGLTIPINGGIVLDLKRLNKIIKIDESSRYALIEPGVSAGQLLAYLNQNFPELQPPIPDAPPSVTIAGNALIHGSGYLSHKYGNHGEMINGLEVVLPNGQICKLGSCAISDSWFTRGPIPDMIGLFISSFGTMGVVTKLAIRLYPKPKMREIAFALMKDESHIPDLINKITYTDLAEDILIGKQDKPQWMKGYCCFITYITGDKEKVIGGKIKKLKRIYRKNGARYMKAPDRLRDIFLEKPQFAARAADFRKGGGFEYVGSFVPIEKIPGAIRKASQISEDHNIVPTLVCRIIGKAHNVMFAATYAFNRADPEDMKNARSALHETNKMVLDLGGIPWKTELAGQKEVIKHMDSGYKQLFHMIRKSIDPNRIMNPGNWEVK
ncbi:MAG: FAD-binding oxidoreductase [Promethearchaeia archaeon]